MSPVLDKTREGTWLAILIVIAFQFGGYFVVPSAHFLDDLRSLEIATRGLVQPTLVNNLFVLPILCFVIFGIGRLRPPDVGWYASAIGPALLVTAAVWIGCQVALALAVPVFNGQLVWHDAWAQFGLVVGGLLAFAATALSEETVFRGFLLPQFYVKASRRCRRPYALVLALMCSQALFAFSHIHPKVLLEGPGGPDFYFNQLRLFVDGLLYAGVYLLTRNLFVCVGLHMLYNQPTSLVQVSRGDAQSVSYVFVLIVLVSWPLARKLRDWRLAPNAREKRFE